MRLFVAVNLPEHERQAIWDATAPLREAGLPLRPCATDTLHLTLKFLGSVPGETMDAIGASLAEAVRPARTFDLALGGFGAFPGPRHPRVVWLGVERHPALELLANDVERAVSRHGFEPELRPFAPHITLARAHKDEGAAAFEQLDEVLAGLSWESVIPVESVDLMESIPGPQGSTYRLVHRAPLLAGG